MTAIECNRNNVFIFNVVIAVATLVSVFALVWALPNVNTPTRDTTCMAIATESAGLNCGKNTDVLQDYLNRAIQNQNEIQQKKMQEAKANSLQLKQNNAELYLEIIPAAKLTGTDQPEPRESDLRAEMVPIREWKSGMSLRDVGGFMRYGVQYRHGRLVVPVAGTYFVYSFLDFYEECNTGSGHPEVNCNGRPIQHALYKFNIKEGVEKEITASVQARKNSTGVPFNSYGNYVSTLVELEAGDEISVKVSDIRYLKYTRENYFGLNLI